MMEQAVDVMMKSAATGQVSDTNKIVQVWWHETMQHTKCHDSHLEAGTLWQMPPM